MSRAAVAMRCGLALAVVAAGCGRTELEGPPELKVGRVECAECGMIVNEERCSSALLIERDGTREHAIFDDLGCMLDYQHAHGGEFRLVGGFVHDHGTRRWVPAATAVYLAADSDDIKTPMASGMVAFADSAAAEAAQAKHGGAIMDAVGLAAARRAWHGDRK